MSSGMAERVWRRVLRCQWDGEVECRTVTDRALDPDLAPVHLDDLLNDREAQPGPRDRLGGAAPHPPEPLENVADLVRWDTKAGVGDADERKPTFRAGRQGHDPAVGRVLGSVVRQVAHHLDHAVAIAGDDWQAGVEVGLELDNDRRSGGRPCYDVSDHIVDVDIRQADAHAARLHAVEVEHVADEAVDPVRVIEYVAAVGPYLLGLDAAISNQLTEPLDPCPRGPEFAGHDRKELGRRA